MDLPDELRLLELRKLVTDVDVSVDEVAVAVDDVGVFESTSTPRTVEIPASAYTDDAGQPRLVYVFAANKLRGPVLIDVYRPG